MMMESKESKERKPKGYWNDYTNCENEVKKFKTRKELKKKSNGCYEAIIRNGWKELFNYDLKLSYIECENIILSYKNKTEFRNKNSKLFKYIIDNNWTYEDFVKPKPILSYDDCKIEALKYDSKVRFKKESTKYYSKIIRNKWYELLDHITNKCKKRSYDECKVEALKYNSKKLFSKNPHYSTIITNKWYELIIHMESMKPKGYWTYDRCKEEALKYTDRKDYMKNSKGCRHSIYTNKWFELLEHLPIKGHKYKRLIYVYEFDNNYCYVGLTSDIERRDKSHNNSEDSPVYKHKIKYNLVPNLCIKSDYINVKDAVKMEEYILNQYKNNNWYILNKNKTGSLGGSTLIWTREKCEEELKKYKSSKEFLKNCRGALNSIYKNKWQDLYPSNFF